MESGLEAQLSSARAATDSLFGLLAPEAFAVRPIAERHRLLFYLGHLEAFDWNLLCRDCAGRPSRDEALERLFAFGIDPVEGELPTDTLEDWPSMDTLRAFNGRVRAEVDEVVATAPRVGFLEQGWALRAAIEHRWMHEETLAYLFWRLPAALKCGVQRPTLVDAPAPAQVSVQVPAGPATLGLSRADFPFRGWDNEYDEHTVAVPAFTVDRFPVTNADYLRFVEAGGYRESTYWRPEDWAWRARSGVEHPAFWRFTGATWHLVTLAGEEPLPPSWPAWVSHAEASAYATWAGKRLMTEPEFHRAAYGTPSGEERPFPWGDDAPRPGVHGHFGMDRFDPGPVDGTPGGDSGFGLAQLVGNGWEWTSTVFAPFEGFTPAPFYPGYSARFFDGKHFVMKGAGTRTHLGFLHRSFRNWFQPHYPYVTAKFRCVEADR